MVDGVKQISLNPIFFSSLILAEGGFVLKRTTFLQLTSAECFFFLFLFLDFHAPVATVESISLQ